MRPQSFTILCVFKSIKHVQLNKSEVTIHGSVYGKLTAASFETEVIGL